jgi:hypothetical protein
MKTVFSGIQSTRLVPLVRAMIIDLVAGGIDPERWAASVQSRSGAKKERERARASEVARRTIGEVRKKVGLPC